MVIGSVFDLELFKQLVVDGIVLGSAYALIAVSFGIIYSTTRIFHLAHAVVYAVVAYAAALTVSELDAPLGVAVAVGLAVGAALGVAIELLFYRPMRRRKATALAFFLVSLGLTIAGPNLLQIGFGPENRPLPGFPTETISLSTATLTNLNLMAVTVSWACILALLVFLDRTKYGRAITAARTNQEMAMAVGISVDRIVLLVFGIGSLLVGISSLLFTMEGVAFPNMGLAPVLTGFIAVFLGGIGSTIGAALGGLVLGLATSLSALWLTGDYAPAVVFGVMFLLLIVRPQGLLGRAGV